MAQWQSMKTDEKLDFLRKLALEFEATLANQAGQIEATKRHLAEVAKAVEILESKQEGD